ncbi:hemerythrin [Thermoanaerobacter thermohydrosulfuricus]|uniref:Hemerythrin n=1 Tax=Thermoanaerobacter thermohydrosulfuricus TaxID=1516 RepID=A0A1G7V2K9_THETY|nr:bacteriohemerythrin [Thermoanaerobacter thermohydrosulfuricus]SDG53974.1 hemerythrin [Thermoanaerobacter thermohydrosulfuricus]
MKWTESLSVGNDYIDEQHKEWIRRINDLLEAYNQKRGKEKVEEAMEFVKKYTVTHFSAEQELMKKYKYPEYEIHKQIHDNFIKEVNELDEKIKKEGPTLTNLMTVVKVNIFLYKKWNIILYKKCTKRHSKNC